MMRNKSLYEIGYIISLVSFLSSPLSVMRAADEGSVTWHESSSSSQNPHVSANEAHYGNAFEYVKRMNTNSLLTLRKYARDEARNRGLVKKPSSAESSIPRAEPQYNNGKEQLFSEVTDDQLNQLRAAARQEADRRLAVAQLKETRESDARSYADFMRYSRKSRDKKAQQQRVEKARTARQAFGNSREEALAQKLTHSMAYEFEWKRRVQQDERKEAVDVKQDAPLGRGGDALRMLRQGQGCLPKDPTKNLAPKKVPEPARKSVLVDMSKVETLGAAREQARLYTEIERMQLSDPQLKQLRLENAKTMAMQQLEMEGSPEFSEIRRQNAQMLGKDQVEMEKMQLSDPELQALRLANERERALQQLRMESDPAFRAVRLQNAQMVGSEHIEMEKMQLSDPELQRLRLENEKARALQQQAMEGSPEFSELRRQNAHRAAKEQAEFEKEQLNDTDLQKLRLANAKAAGEYLFRANQYARGTIWQEFCSTFRYEFLRMAALMTIEVAKDRIPKIAALLSSWWQTRKMSPEALQIMSDSQEIEESLAVSAGGLAASEKQYAETMQKNLDMIRAQMEVVEKMGRFLGEARGKMVEQQKEILDVMLQQHNATSYALTRNLFSVRANHMRLMQAKMQHEQQVQDYVARDKFFQLVEVAKIEEKPNKILTAKNKEVQPTASFTQQQKQQLRRASEAHKNEKVRTVQQESQEPLPASSPLFSTWNRARIGD